MISNSPNLRNRISAMRYLGMSTLTQKAMNEARTLFDRGARNDSDVEKVVVLFSDGRTFGGKQTLVEPVNRLREV